MNLLVNIDVADLDRATRFYCDGLGLHVGLRFEGWVELRGTGSPIYLLRKEEGTPASPRSAERRRYCRHWTPVHLDFVVEDLDAAVGRARDAGATVEGDVGSYPWGRIARLADPFGHGFCLLEFRGRGYVELPTLHEWGDPPAVSPTGRALLRRNRF